MYIALKITYIMLIYIILYIKPFIPFFVNYIPLFCSVTTNTKKGNQQLFFFCLTKFLITYRIVQ